MPQWAQRTISSVPLGAGAAPLRDGAIAGFLCVNKRVTNSTAIITAIHNSNLPKGSSL